MEEAAMISQIDHSLFPGDRIKIISFKKPFYSVTCRGKVWLVYEKEFRRLSALELLAECAEDLAGF